MPVLNLSKKAAVHMRKNLNFGDEEEEIVIYSFEMLFNCFFTIALICLTAWLSGCLPTALTATLVVLLLRSFSGGAHSSASINCTFISAVAAVSIGKISIICGSQMPATANIIFVLAVLLISLRIMWVLAPVDSAAKPVTSDSHRRQLRALSLAAVTAISALQLVILSFDYGLFARYSLAVSLGTAWQTFTLTRAGHKFVSMFDDIINKLPRR
ncbi:MAG TPA: accessory gene regulator B family protein [Bacillota bacterium]|nr:accessory gene regulator B family protein [Bacillota bacterium]